MSMRFMEGEQDGWCYVLVPPGPSKSRGLLASRLVQSGGLPTLVQENGNGNSLSRDCRMIKWRGFERGGHDTQKLK